jgi:5'-nucleotidase
MNILLTNDDGIHAPGIYALYLKLKKLGTVHVVAPDSQRSSVGHAITLAHPIWHSKVKRDKTFFGHAVSGTPADCVKFAIDVLFKEKPDLIISGINLGSNDGCSVFYSGTVAGAREGALLGIPSIAVSLDTFSNPDFSYASKFIIRFIKNFKTKLMPKGTFLNINVPNVKESKIKGIKMTKQGMIPIHGVFKKYKDPNQNEYFWLTGKTPVKRKDFGFDTYALAHNYVTVTPIHCDSTDYQFLDELESWKVN